MKPQLSKTFEGTPVAAAGMKITGKAAERVGQLAYGEEVYVIIRGVVAKVAHGDVAGVFTRLHDVKATALVLLDRKDGERMLDEASLLADERFGIRNLFNQPPDDPPRP